MVTENVSKKSSGEIFSCMQVFVCLLFFVFEVLVIKYSVSFYCGDPFSRNLL